MPRYNLLYVFADQMRYDIPDYAGGTHHICPNLDAMAAESVNMTEAVSSNPICGPYRACLFTGRNCTSNGMVINEIRFNPHQRCIGHVLTENGYRSAYIGKWHLYSDELRNFYDPKNSFTPPGEHRLGFDDYWAAYGFSHAYYGDLAFYHLDTPERICAGDRYMPDVQTDLCIDRMKYYSEHPDRPFAMFLSYSTPHGPWRRDNVPEECYNRLEGADFPNPPNFSEEDDPHGDIWAHLSDGTRARLPEWRRIYEAMIANIDDNIGRIMAALREYGLDKNTIVVFTSDHGECFGSHGRRQKSVFYDEAARVPFLIRLPGGAHARRCDAPISTVDIMPTLLGMLDLPIPSEVEGTDISGLLCERDSNAPEFAFMQGTGSVAIYADGYEWRAIRNKNYTYGIWLRDAEEHLYDNQRDPYQMHNLASDPEYSELLGRLRAWTDRHMQSIGDKFPPVSLADRDWVFRRRVWRSANRQFDDCPYGDAANRPADEPLYLDGGERFAFYPIYDPRDSYTVAHGVKVMMDYVFYGAYNLRRVSLPDTLEQINNGAFSECAVEELDIPDGCTTIMAGAFYRAREMRRIRIPASVTRISESAFDECPNLTLEVTPGSVAENFCIRYNKKYSLV
jgi:arylsulfatase A-like enzyme